MLLVGNHFTLSPIAKMLLQYKRKLHEGYGTFVNPNIFQNVTFRKHCTNLVLMIIDPEIKSRLLQKPFRVCSTRMAFKQGLTEFVLSFCILF